MQMTMIEALNSALALELERDRRVVVFGEDIGANGGVFRATGVRPQFADRLATSGARLRPALFESKTEV